MQRAGFSSSATEVAAAAFFEEKRHLRCAECSEQDLAADRSRWPLVLDLLVLVLELGLVIITQLELMQAKRLKLFLLQSVTIW